MEKMAGIVHRNRPVGQCDRMLSFTSSTLDRALKPKTSRWGMGLDEEASRNSRTVSLAGDPVGLLGLGDGAEGRSRKAGPSAGEPASLALFSSTSLSLRS